MEKLSFEQMENVHGGIACAKEKAAVGLATLGWVVSWGGMVTAAIGAAGFSWAYADYMACMARQ